MFSKTKIAIGFALLLTFLLTAPVFAGGWAVITLDELPTNVKAGEEFTVGFVVLQHGKTPMAGLTPTITASLNKDEHFIVMAKEDGKPGHYIAEVTFPKEGDWNWSIQAFSMDQQMPTLSVAASSVASISKPVEETQIKEISISPLLVASILTAAIGLVGLFITLQRKSRVAAIITALSLISGVVLFVTGTSVPKVEAQSESPSIESSNSSISQVELGKNLFIAKGCITCHYNTKAASRSEYWTIEMGAPDLSNYSGAPEILESRLKDPTSVLSTSQMPQLDLTMEEIQALIAFINSN